MLRDFYSCVQVKIHKLLLQSRFRTRKKQEADLFFVPTYVKCVRMSGGLTDKEINQTYVKVLQYRGLNNILIDNLMEPKVTYLLSVTCITAP